MASGFEKRKKEGKATPPLSYEGDTSEVQAQRRKLKEIKKAEESARELDVTMMSDLEYYLDNNDNVDFGFLERDEVIRAVPVETLLELDLQYPGTLLKLFVNECKDGLPPEQGEKITVNFRGNQEANALIGAGNLLPAYIRVAKITSSKGTEIGERKSSGNINKVGYYNRYGRYLPVFSDYEIYVPADEEAEDWKTEMLLSEDAEVMIKDGDKIKELEEQEKDLKERFKEDVKKAKEIQKLSFEEYLKQEAALSDMDNRSNDPKEKIPASAEDLFEFVKDLELDKADLGSVNRVFKAIAQQESNNNYNALGVVITNPSSHAYMQRAMGKYQMTPNRWREWSKKFFDGKVAFPSVRNQDLIAFKRMATHYKEFKNKGSNKESIVKLIAVSWYGNNGVPFNDIDDIDDNPPFWGPTPLEYSNSVWGRYQKLSNKS